MDGIVAASGRFAHMVEPWDVERSWWTVRHMPRLAGVCDSLFTRSRGCWEQESAVPFSPSVAFSHVNGQSTGPEMSSGLRPPFDKRDTQSTQPPSDHPERRGNRAQTLANSTYTTTWPISKALALDTADHRHPQRRRARATHRMLEAGQALSSFLESGAGGGCRFPAELAPPAFITRHLSF